MNEFIKRLRMGMVCLNIALTSGTLTAWWITKQINPTSLICVAINTALLLTFYKKEVKELKDKLFGDKDDFSGGSFG